jgi:hypothetical protein
MMSPEVKAKLTVVRDALRALVGALEAENWRFTAAWENAAAEAEAMIASNSSLDSVASWVMNVSRLFGAGMGSFSDTYLGDDVDRIRDELQRKLWDLAETCRAAPGSELRIRRYLTAIESALLAHGATELAGDFRRVLSAEALDLEAVRRLADATLGGAAAIDAVRELLPALRGELDAIAQAPQ